MANEAEIQRLVVRLMGDASHYTATLNTAVNETGAAVARIQSQLNSIKAATPTGGIGTSGPNVSGVSSAKAAVESHTRSLKDAAIAAKQAADAQAKFVAEAAKITARSSPMEGYKKEIASLNTHLAAGTISQRVYNDSVSNAAMKLPLVRQAQKEYNDNLRDAARITESMRAPMERYVDTQVILGKHLINNRINQETYNRAMKQAAQDASTNWQEVGSNLRIVGGTIAAVGAGITGLFGGLIATGLKSAVAFEQTTIAFTTLLGSAVEAKETLKELVQFAAVTPFELPEVERAARTMILFGERGKELTATLTAIGNAAAASGSDFGEIALIFNQIRGVGHLIQQDFRQLAIRAVISLEDIALFYGVTTTEAQKMQRAQAISFEDVKQMFKNLSKEGGRFANAMEVLNRTLGGQWTNLKDRATIALREMGTAFLPLGKRIVATLIETMTWFSNLSESTKSSVAWFAALGAGLGVVITALGATVLVVGQLALAYNALMTATAAASASAMAMSVASLAAKAGLVGLAVAGVAALTYAIYRLNPAIRDLNKELDRNKKLTDDLVQRAAEATSKIFEELKKIKGGAERKVFIELELAKADKISTGLQSRLQLAQKVLDEMAPHVSVASSDQGKTLDLWASWWETSKASFKNQVMLTNELQAASDAAAKAVVDLGRELAEVTFELDPIATKEDVKAAEDYVKALKLEAATLGMTKDAAKVYELQQQLIEAETIKEIQLLQEKIALFNESNKAMDEASKAAEKFNENTRKTVEELGKSITTFGMSKEEIMLWEMEQGNALPIVLDLTKSLIDQKMALDNHKKLMDEGKKVAEKFITPMDKLMKTVDDLTRMFEKEAFGPEVFKKAIAEAKEEMLEAQNKAKEGVKLKFSVEGLAGVKKDSKEVRQSMIQEQRLALEAAQKLKVDWAVANRQVANIPLAEGGVPPGWKPPEGMLKPPMSNVAPPPMLAKAPMSYEEVKDEFFRRWDADKANAWKNLSGVNQHIPIDRGPNSKPGDKGIDAGLHKALLDRLVQAAEKTANKEQQVIEPLGVGGGGGGL